MKKIMFEKLKKNEMYVEIKDVMYMYEYGRKNGIVMDYGDGV